MSVDSSSLPGTFFAQHPVLRAAQLVVWTYAGFLVAQYAVGFIVAGLLFLHVPLRELGDAGFSVVVTALVYLVSLLLVVGVPALFKQWESVKAFARLVGLIHKPKLRYLAFTPAIYVLYFFVAGALITIIAQLSPGFDPGEAQNVGFENITHLWEYIAAFVALVICAPIAEELLFRGFLFGSLRERLAFWPSTLLVSGLFGFVHGQWNVAIDTFLLSGALCYLRERSQSLWPAILLHMIKNGVAYYFLFVQL
ncbi:MAG TPA: CPBP family intramembrane glutamic endopeptidase [Candidatus Saccharimonadales bacterium]